MFSACYLTKGKLAPVIPAVLIEPFVGGSNSPNSNKKIAQF